MENPMVIGLVVVLTAIFVLWLKGLFGPKSELGQFASELGTNLRVNVRVSTVSKLADANQRVGELASGKDVNEFVKELSAFNELLGSLK